MPLALNFIGARFSCHRGLSRPFQQRNLVGDTLLKKVSEGMFNGLSDLQSGLFSIKRDLCLLPYSLRSYQISHYELTRYRRSELCPLLS